MFARSVSVSGRTASKKPGIRIGRRCRRSRRGLGTLDARGGVRDDGGERRMERRPGHRAPRARRRACPSSRAPASAGRMGRDRTPRRTRGRTRVPPDSRGSSPDRDPSISSWPSKRNFTRIGSSPRTARRPSRPRVARAGRPCRPRRRGMGAGRHELWVRTAARATRRAGRAAGRRNGCTQGASSPSGPGSLRRPRGRPRSRRSPPAGPTSASGRGSRPRSRAATNSAPKCSAAGRGPRARRAIPRCGPRYTPRGQARAAVPRAWWSHGRESRLAPRRLAAPWRTGARLAPPDCGWSPPAPRTRHSRQTLRRADPDAAELREHLRLAMQVELSTVPLYLYALRSIDDQAVRCGRNDPQHCRRGDAPPCARREPARWRSAESPNRGARPSAGLPEPAREPPPAAHAEPRAGDGRHRCDPRSSSSSSPTRPGHPKTRATTASASSTRRSRMPSSRSGPRCSRHPRGPPAVGSAVLRCGRLQLRGQRRPDADRLVGVARAAIDVIVHQGEGLNDSKWADEAHQELTHFAKFLQIAEGTSPIGSLRPLPVNPSAATIRRTCGPFRTCSTRSTRRCSCCSTRCTAASEEGSLVTGSTLRCATSWRPSGAN